MAIGRRWRSWSRLPPVERASAIEAAAALAICKLLIVALPFRLYLPLLRRSSLRALPPVTPLDAGLVAQVRRALARVSRALPWRSACLDKAMAAKLMLARRGRAATLHLGLRRSGAGLEAHAWLEAAGCTVVGGGARAGMADLARFGAADETRIEGVARP